MWFCSRECQVLAARQGHSGANCRDGAQASKATEVVPRVPDVAGPITAAPGMDSATLAAAANACLACGKADVKLLCCGQCRGVWFCNRERQNVARKELNHRSANCRPADGVQREAPSSANARQLQPR